MKVGLLARRGLWHYRSEHAAQALAVAVAVAVLVGALTVGASVKGSLRTLAVRRLGTVHAMVQGVHPFRRALAEAIPGQDGRQYAAAAWILPTQARRPRRSMEPGAEPGGRDGDPVPFVTLFGVGADFGARVAGEPLALKPRTAAVTPALAEALGRAGAPLRVGDPLFLDLSLGSQGRSDTIFARREADQTLRGVRVTVARILDERGLGAFALRADDTRPRAVYLDQAWVGELLGQPARANAIFLGVTTEARGTLLAERIREKLIAPKLTLEDLGLRLGGDEKEILIQSDRFILGPTEIAAITGAARNASFRHRAYALYLLNTIARTGKAADKPTADARPESAPRASVPYSLVIGLPPQDGPGSAAETALAAAAGEGDGGGLVLGAWAAEALGVEAGKTVRLAWYTLDDKHRLQERDREYPIAAVAEQAHLARYRDYVPAYAGFTDAATINDWDPPMPIDLDRVTPADEAYWDRYGPAPKAALPLAVVEALGGAGGGVNTIRLTDGEAEAGAPIAPTRREQVLTVLRNALAESSLAPTVRHLRADALAAASGSTSYSQLFLGMGFFVIVAALGLVVMLFRLMVERRVRFLGALSAMGFRPEQIRTILLLEGAMVALGGVALGVPFGVLYAMGLLWALGTVWAGAVSDYPLALHLDSFALGVGAGLGFVLALASIWYALRRLKSVPAKRLLAGDLRGRMLQPSRDGRMRLAAAFLFLGGMALASAAFQRWLPMSPTCLLGGGMLLLAGILITLGGGVPSGMPRGLWGLSVRLQERRRMRATMVVGLLACASFLLVLVAAFRLDFRDLDPWRADGGTGGYPLVARTSLPVLRPPDGDWSAVGATTAEAKTLAPVRLVSLRESDGESVGCLNINRPMAPRMLGVPARFAASARFATASVEPPYDTPWQALRWQARGGEHGGDGAGQPVVPAIADAASATYILHLAVGDEMEVPTPRGPMRVRLVGTLRQSIFQGEMLIPEAAFLHYFGDDSGYRRFLATWPRDARALAETRAALRGALGRYGVEVTPATEVLARYARVQNTYLATFNALGGLGLLLGAGGVAAVVLRNVLERRRELALMRAIGYGRVGLVLLLMLQNGRLILRGIVVGALAGLIAAAPQWLRLLDRIPWPQIAVVLGLAILCGLLSCFVASVVAMRGRLIDGLRSE